MLCRVLETAESQNHRIVAGGKGFLQIMQSNSLCSEQGKILQIAQGPALLGFKGQRLHNILRHLIQSFTTLVIKMFLSAISSISVCLCWLLSCHLSEESGFKFFGTPYQVCMQTDRVPLSLLHSRLNTSSSLVLTAALSPQSTSSRMSMSLLCCRAWIWTQHTKCDLNRGKDHLLPHRMWWNTTSTCWKCFS